MYLLNLLAIARYETPAASAIAAVGTPMLLRVSAMVVSSSLARAKELEAGVFDR